MMPFSQSISGKLLPLLNQTCGSIVKQQTRHCSRLPSWLTQASNTLTHLKNIVSTPDTNDSNDSKSSKNDKNNYSSRSYTWSGGSFSFGNMGGGSGGHGAGGFPFPGGGDFFKQALEHCQQSHAYDIANRMGIQINVCLTTINILMFT